MPDADDIDLLKQKITYAKLEMHDRRELMDSVAGMLHAFRKWMDQWHSKVDKTLAEDVTRIKAKAARLDTMIFKVRQELENDQRAISRVN